MKNIPPEVHVDQSQIKRILLLPRQPIKLMRILITGSVVVKLETSDNAINSFELHLKIVEVVLPEKNK